MINILKEMCRKLLINEKAFKENMRNLNTQYQDRILKQINDVNIIYFQFKISQGEIHEL